MQPIAILLAASALGLALAPPLSGDRDTGERPAGTLVFLSSGNLLTSVDVASGRRTVRRIRGIPSCAPDLQVTGGRVVFAGVRKQRTVVFSIPIGLDRPPKLLGAAHAYVPSATEGRVWLAGVDCDRSRMVGVREVTVDGRTTMSSHRPVPRGWLTGAVDTGLVLWRSSHRKHATVVWNPRTGRTSGALNLEAVIDTRGQLMAGCVVQTRCRRLAILDRDRGRTTVARPPAPFKLDSAATLSPDGSLLAAPASSNRSWRMALVNTRDGTTTIVPGSATGKTYPVQRWSSSGGWLFFRSGRNRLMAYRQGEPRAIPLPFKWPHKAVAYVAG